ncbi:tetratricopeptide repeat protein [Methylocystis sp. L43]|uniref:tetratricopeptide repeat protein n=1 Tax=unclassified Methylocystis TaxID=2625913 RepID=UPI0032B2B503
MGRVFRRPCATILFLTLALAPTTPIAARAGVNDGVREEMRPGEPGYQELALAFARVAKGDYEGALKYAQRARSLAPDYEMPVRLLADILNKLGRMGEAVDVINDFVASHKHSMALIAQRGHLRKRLMDVAGAEADFRSALRSGALNQEQAAAVDAALFDLAMSAAYKDFNESRLNEAIEKARAAREMDKKAEAPVRLIAEAFSRQGRAQAALDELNRYISQNKPSGRLLAQRGYLRRAMQDVKGAEADFEAALAAPDIEPSETAPLRNALAEAAKAERDSIVQAELAEVYAAIAKRDYARAVKAARALRAKYPNAEAPLFALMTALTKSRQAEAAVKEADAFIKDNTPSSTLLAQRGYSRRATGDLPGAIADFRAALAQPALEPAQVKRLKLALAEAERANERGGSLVAAPQATPLQQALNSGYDALKVGQLDEAVRAAREAHSLDPKAEEPVLLLLTALLRQGRKAEALAEANRYLASVPQSPGVLAQRGFMRRQAKDVSGAVADFEQALKYGLPADQKLNVARALDEARYTLVAEKAFKALAARDWVSALRYGRAAEAFPRADEAVFRVTIAALAGLGHTDEALRASNALIARGKATGQAYAQRAYLRKTLGDGAGALADFVKALDRGDLPAAQRVAVELEVAAARSSAYETQGDLTRARDELVNFAHTHPDYAAGWSTLGQFYARQKEYAAAVAAFENSLAVERSGEVLLNAGYASVYVDRSKESQFFREALDRWSSDPSLSARPPRDREVIRTQIVESDASVRTLVVFNGIADRRKRWGGHQLQPSFETVIRFDGRFLPNIFGLEGLIGGFWSQDQTRFTESYSRLGLRLRPFDGVNFSVSAEWQHYFTRNAPFNQLALSWGYGYGGFAYSSAPSAGAAGAIEPTDMSYPHETAWQPLTSFATFGTYRAGERRYLQNAVGLLGYSYWNADSRVVLGAAAMGMGTYDSADTRRFAFGAGPALVARTWLGGDFYRAFDGILTAQIGYLFPFGESRRQGGLNATIGISF